MAPATRSRGRKRISYKEDDSSSDLSGQDGGGSSDEPAPNTRSRSSRQGQSDKLPSRHIRKTAVSSHASRSARSKQKLRHSTASVNSEDCENAIASLGGKVPRWESLPYHILADIFFYASRPLWLHYFNTTPHVAWLLNSALICKAFAEPALSALYYSPPLVPPTRAEALFIHLSSQTEDSTFNYRVKVKYLEIESVAVLIQRASARYIELPDLLRFTPQLRGLTLCLPTDIPDMRMRYTASYKFKPTPQQVISRALASRSIALQQLEYNCEVMGLHTLPMFIEPNPSPYSHSLRSLTFTRYTNHNSSEEELAIGLMNLPHLRKLSFMSSDIVNQKLLPLLPNDLEQFTIAGCENVTSEVLSPFLATHGASFQQLTLDHNQWLNLSFLAGLANACPRLQTLRADLTFYYLDRFQPNLDPRFDRLFGDEAPSWPESLQKLELFHLRKWNLTIAERFFSSLVDSAALLPDLRYIDIKASLDESGWRDRVGFRDKWASRLRGVFLRVFEPPNPLLKSIRIFEEHKSQSKKSNGINKSNGVVSASKHKSDPKLLNPSEPSASDHLQADKFGHKSIKKDTVKAKRDTPSDGDVPLATIRRSKRLKMSQGGQVGRALHPSSSTRQTRQKTGSDDDSSGEGSGAEDDGLYAGPKAPPATRRRTRRRKRGSDQGSSSEDSAIDDDAGEEISKPEALDDAGQEYHVQGLCDVVRIVIDNLRPTEVQLNEDDFLDEEVSGDEDWNGDEEAEGDAVYAW